MTLNELYEQLQPIATKHVKDCLPKETPEDQQAANVILCFLTAALQDAIDGRTSLLLTLASNTGILALAWKSISNETQQQR